MKLFLDGKIAWGLLTTTSAPVSMNLSDWNMPNETGLDLLKRVRSHPLFSKTPFIFITAENSPTNRAQASIAGASAYLQKPFGLDDLKKTIQKVADANLTV